MPILKPISGHGSTGGIRRYLEKGGRALARDLFNLSYDERDGGALGDEAKEACAWDAEMDATRAAFGTDAPWRGKPARTFKHFVLSPDPGDDIDLAALRELACSWALKHFGDHEIAIVYHDDNARGIPHAHIVVNNANLRTGYRMQTQHPEDLNRDLQDMARERGLSGLSNDRAPESPSRARGHAGAGGPRSRRSVYLGRAEKEIMRSGGYSWVGDIRARVALAKTTARDEAEFLGILDALGVHVADNSAKARRDDWVFSLAEEPSKKVSGERLGFVYGKEMLRRPFCDPALLALPLFVRKILFSPGQVVYHKFHYLFLRGALPVELNFRIYPVNHGYVPEELCQVQMGKSPEKISFSLYSFSEGRVGPVHLFAVGNYHLGIRQYLVVPVPHPFYFRRLAGKLEVVDCLYSVCPLV